MRKILSLMTVASIAVGVMAAGNSRVNSLSSSPMFNDSYDMIKKNPAYSAKYYNFLQAAGGFVDEDDQLEHLFGTYRVNDLFTIGAYYSPGQSMSSKFLNGLPTTFWNSSETKIEEIDGKKVVVPINRKILQEVSPHILMGFNLGDAKLGLDLFWETSDYSDKRETTDNLSNTDTEKNIEYRNRKISTSMSEKRDISQPGFKLGALIPWGDMTVDLTGMLAFPTVKYERHDTTKTTTTTKDHINDVEDRDPDKVVTTDRRTAIDNGNHPGLNTAIGALFTIPASNDVRYRLGAKYSRESYGYHVETGDTTKTETKEAGSVIETVDSKEKSGTIADKKVWNTFALTAGVHKMFEGDLAFGFSDEFSIEHIKTTPEVITNDAPEKTDLALKHKLIAAIEKNYGKTKYLDGHAFRVSFATNVNTNFYSEKGDESGSETVNTTKTVASESVEGSGKTKTDWGPVNINAGAGIKKGRFGFDFFLENLDFNFSNNEGGVWGLMPVAGATMTFDFGGEYAEAASTPKRNPIPATPKTKKTPFNEEWN